MSLYNNDHINQKMLDRFRAASLELQSTMLAAGFAYILGSPGFHDRPDLQAEFDGLCTSMNEMIGKEIQK